MSASFFGIEALVTGMASVLKNELHAQLRPGPLVGEAQIAAFELLQNNLDELFTALQTERLKVE